MGIDASFRHGHTLAEINAFIFNGVLWAEDAWLCLS